MYCFYDHDITFLYWYQIQSEQSKESIHAANLKTLSTTDGKKSGILWLKYTIVQWQEKVSETFKIAGISAIITQVSSDRHLNHNNGQSRWT